ncbi:MAG: hypothetical protein ISN28_11275 [Ectothiorhodospiraceae bacterium AqS1]|nr:hypothetical protein [Ectothiorhodospiraceae bacterium AqS1]
MFGKAKSIDNKPNTRVAKSAERSGLVLGEPSSGNGIGRDLETVRSIVVVFIVNGTPWAMAARR